MQVYIAASFPRKQEARKLRDSLRKLGIKTKARWLSEKDSNYSGTGYRTMLKASLEDFEDIKAADLLIQLTGDNMSRGGRHSELGLALADNKPAFLVGPREQIFHWHPNVMQFDTAKDLRLFLKSTTIPLTTAGNRAIVTVAH